MPAPHALYSKMLAERTASRNVLFFLFFYFFWLNVVIRFICENLSKRLHTCGFHHDFQLVMTRAHTHTHVRAKSVRAGSSLSTEARSPYRPDHRHEANRTEVVATDQAPRQRLRPICDKVLLRRR